MIVLLIRHGESEADILNVHEGRADFNLTERGNRQAEAMAQYVASKFKLAKIYASPLKRAAQAAKHLSDATGSEIIFDDNLMEFNNGLLAGLSYEEADRLYPEVPDLPIDQAVYGQESRVEFRGRAEAFLQRLVSENGEDDQVAVVTHGGMLNQLYGAMLHTPIEQNTLFGTGDTGIHIWSVSGDRTVVIRANYTDHVKDI